MFKAAILLAHQYNMTIEGEFIGWQAEQTTGDIIDALDVTCDAVSISNVVGIVGPELSREAHLIAPFGKKIGIPVISYSATDPDLSDKNTYPNFYRTVSSDDAAALALVKLFIRFKWTSCTIIYQNDAFGLGGATKVIRGDLKSLLTNAATRIVVIWAESLYTSMILQEGLDFNVVGPYFTWILSVTIPLNSFKQRFHQNLIGILLMKPTIGSVVNASINATLLNAAYSIWQQYEPESFPGSMNVDYYALFAFDATWTLIQSLQQLCASKINSSSCLSFVNAADCFGHRFINSKLLLDAVTRTEFLGISGPIQFNVNVTDRITGLYYSAKNAQPSSNGLHFVPILEYSHPGDWRISTQENIIIWPGNTLTQPTGRASLQNVNLRIGIIESDPFTIVEKVTDASGQSTIEYNGYVPDLIKRLQNNMGFIPTIKLAPSNQTYNELILAVSNGVYDIVIGDVTVTAERRELVDFSSSIYDDSLRILIRKTGNVNIDLFSFLKPFSRNLWLLLLGTLIYSGILVFIIERQNNEALQNRSILSQISMSLWYSFGTVVGYGVDFSSNTASGRLLTGGLYILSLILVASYTANLASELTIAKSKTFISGIDDIKNGKIPFNRFGVVVGSSDEEYYLREISNSIRNFYPLQSYEESFDDLRAGIIDASFVDSGNGEYVLNNIYCDLTAVGDGFSKTVFAIVTPKEWLYAQDLDVNILSLKESGELENLREKWFEVQNCSSSDATSIVIGIEATSGLFLVFRVISILSLLLFAWLKRHTIKNRLFQLIYPKKYSPEIQDSMKRRSRRTSENSQNHETALPTILYL
ncbi:unnamed protein product [Rotaria sp. Silwood1]|nr:unnamed protein product [Rotaria sp. Silwood1]CAF4863747.1 unnamed protein product [Rotaria sp. Silwood1]